MRWASFRPHVHVNGRKPTGAPRKNSGSARADQRDPLQQLEWMEPRATPMPMFRGAHMKDWDRENPGMVRPKESAL